CNKWMNRVSELAGYFVRREFTVQARLWGQPGLTRDVVVLIVPPRAARTVPDKAAEDFSASRRVAN
ncbi:hypothetical protein, partial [Stenotrophomonas maltophilia]|uniref:hypothetical protein n=1 Tax=Stenotrophomonas maltophilia TaxID=40324 RepID=UPI00195418BF